MASTSSLKIIDRSTTTFDTVPIQTDDMGDENISTKSRLLSSEPSVDNSSSSSSQRQTPSMLLPSPPLQFKPPPLVDDGRSIHKFLYDSNSYKSPSFIKAHKLSNIQDADPREFFEKCLMKLHQNDSTVLSLDIDCGSIADHDITHFIEVLAVNSALLELSIIFQQNQLTEGVATQLVETLKHNSTLTRLSLKENRVNEAAATQLSDLLRFNTTLLSLDLFQTGLSENGITHYVQRCV